MKFQTFQKLIVRKESILFVVMILWVLYRIQQPHDDDNNNQIRRSYYYGGVESITQKSFDNHHHVFYANNNSISQHDHYQRTEENNGDWVGDDNHNNNNVEDTSDIDDAAEDEAVSILESKVSANVNDYGNENHQLQQKQQQQDYLLIRPPYRIVQVGGHRTGSTFQLILLCSIVMMRDPNAECKPTSTDLKKEIQSSIINNTSFVVKTHNNNNNNNGDAELQRLGSDGSIVVFSSGGKKGIWNFTKYVQQRSQLERCASCEIREYTKFFNLTQLEISQLQEHMRLYTILRQCCGFQMSKYEALRLHGCNTTKYVNEPSYPHCEDYEKGGGGGGFRQVELDFIASPIPYKCHNPEYNWAKIGDCTKFRDATIGGKGMNGKELSKKEMKSCKVK